MTTDTGNTHGILGAALLGLRTTISLSVTEACSAFRERTGLQVRGVDIRFVEIMRIDGVVEYHLSLVEVDVG